MMNDKQIEQALFGGVSKRTRSLGVNDKHILYDTAKGRCKNPYCRKKISESEMQIGHKKAYSKGGSTTLSNSVCLCYACNRKQGTNSWEKFLKKQAIAKGQAEPKTSKPKKSKPKKKRRSSSGVSLFGNIPKFREPKFRY